MIQNPSASSSGYNEFKSYFFEMIARSQGYLEPIRLCGTYQVHRPKLSELP